MKKAILTVSVILLNLLFINISTILNLAFEPQDGVLVVKGEELANSRGVKACRFQRA